MKKSTKSSIIAGVIIAVIGVVVLVCALGMSGWNFRNVNNWAHDTVTFETPVTKIEIKANYGQVVLKQGLVDVTTVNYEYDDKHRPEIALNEDGLLKIHTAHRGWNEFDYWFEDAPTIEVYLPAEVDLVVVDMQLNAGRIDFGDGYWGSVVDVELNAGSISFGNVSMGDLHLDINAGALDAYKIQCHKLTCQLSAGAFSVKEVSCDAFDCDISAGGVTVKKLDSSQITLDVSAGSAELGLAGAQSEYRISVSKSAGSCNVSNQYGTVRTLTVDISAGSVDITFGK